MSVSVFVLVTLALAISLVISQNTAFNIIPFPIEEAKAINDTIYHVTSLTKQGGDNAGLPQSSFTAPGTTSSCISHDTSARTITISCSSARLSDVYNKLHDNNTLSKHLPDGMWYLNANLVIAKGATFHIDSKDTNWLKISSGVTPRITAVAAVPYHIDVHGSLKIDSVKITSWDPITSNYATTSGTRHDPGAGKRDITVPGAPRPFITVEKDATGTTDITNSEIAYLGYEKGSFSGVGTAGLNYYGGEGSILRDNNIHHLYFGFYSSGVGRMVIENNQVHHNTIYGLDPHTGAHDIIIRKNVVHDNGQFGIICSLNCNNMTGLFLVSMHIFFLCVSTVCISGTNRVMIYHKNYSLE